MGTIKRPGLKCSAELVETEPKRELVSLQQCGVGEATGEPLVISIQESFDEAASPATAVAEGPDHRSKQCPVAVRLLPQNVVSLPQESAGPPTSAHH